MTTKKQKIIISIGLGIITLPFLLVTAVNAVSTPYEPLAPQAQRTYESTKLAHCNAEKSLAAAKLLDIANGVKLEADLNELNKKKEMDCNVGF